MGTVITLNTLYTLCANYMVWRSDKGRNTWSCAWRVTSLPYTSAGTAATAITTTTIITTRKSCTFFPVTDFLYCGGCLWPGLGEITFNATLSHDSTRLSTTTNTDLFTEVSVTLSSTERVDYTLISGLLRRWSHWQPISAPLRPTWCLAPFQAQALGWSDVLSIVEKEGLEPDEIFTFFSLTINVR